MAKCVKEKQSGRICRVSNDIAASMVGSGKYSYAPTSEYRQFLKGSEPNDGSYTGDERLGTPMRKHKERAHA